MSDSNPPSSSPGVGGNQDNDPTLKAFHDQLRAIQGRLEKTAVVGESLSSTQHEIQLHLQAISSRSNQAYDADEDEKAAELKERVRNLALQADEITKESTSISRRVNQNNDDDMDTVCMAFIHRLSFLTKP